MLSEVDVFNSLSALDSTKGAGPDGLPPLFLKQCARSLAYPIVAIFNRSLSSGIFPGKWKVAFIRPIHKSGNIHNVENYRPISILNCLAKVLESIVHTHLYSAVQTIISNTQQGFVKKRSTTSNLMDFVSDVVNRIEKRQQVDAVYVDFAKALDKVPHDLVIEKLRRMGLPLWITSWLYSYLTSRMAFVKIDLLHSVWFDLPSGVPQGCHLGPLLFILFVNDLAHDIKSPKLFYADDLKCYRSIVTRMDSLLLQEDINALLQWCARNGMLVNISKCKITSFSRSHSLLLNNYVMDGEVLERVDAIRDLGVSIDNKARFHLHIATVTAKAHAMLGFIKRNAADFEDVHALKTLYCSLVRSVLEYAVQVWMPYYSSYIDEIEKVQRSFVRFALRRLPWRNYPLLPPYEARCKLIELDTLANRRTALQRMFVFGILNNLIDCSSLLAKVNFHAPLRRLRNPDLLRTALHRTDYGRFEPFNMCCSVFNDVRDVFDFTISKTTFKTRIRNLT